MKRVLALIATAAIGMGLLAGCGDSSTNTPQTGTDDAALSAAEKEENSGTDAADQSSSDENEIALLLNTNASGINDKGFAQYSWEAIQSFGDEYGYTYAYYQPNDTSVESYLSMIDLAINSGAKVCVALGYEFIEAITEAQFTYPDVSFITVDASGIEEYEIADNNYVVHFDTVESGFFAGVAAVYEGYTNLGILSCYPIAPVDRWAYGFIQGANWAAGEKGVEGVTITQYYTGSGDASSDTQALAASWYESGMECIYACVANGNPSVFAAAEAAGKAAIGMDVNQNGESDSVIISSVKNVDVAIVDALTGWKDGEFKGGVIEFKNVDDDSVGLAFEGNHLTTFTEDEYNEILAAFKADENGMRSSLIKFEDVSSMQECYDGIETKNIEFIAIE